MSYIALPFTRFAIILSCLYFFIIATAIIFLRTMHDRSKLVLGQICWFCLALCVTTWIRERHSSLFHSSTAMQEQAGLPCFSLRH